MADGDKGTDIERLLAEVEGTLGGAKPGKVAGPAARRGGGDVERHGSGLTERVRVAALAGAVGAGVVFVIFALLPFLRAGSGAAGAFLATFVAVVLTRRR